jgi:hypothetical protein
VIRLSKTIPSYLLKDKYWGSMLHLFIHNHKLKSVLTDKYFDFEEGTVSITTLKRKAAPWSKSEKFMLYLALHLFNSRNKVDLGDMDYLDQNNMVLAIEAIKMRYS